MISSATRRVIILTVPWHEQTELEVYLQGIWRMCCRGKVMDKKAVVELLCLLWLEEKQGSWGVIAAYVKLLWLSKMDELLGTWKEICTAFFTKRLTAPESLHIPESTFCICSPQPIYKTFLNGCKLYWQKTYLEIISPGISSPCFQHHLKAAKLITSKLSADHLIPDCSWAAEFASRISWLPW